MQTFKSLLADFDNTLKKYNPEAYGNLLPPLSDKEINKDLSKIKISDENVKALFQWKGGSKNERGSMLSRHGILLTFDQIKDLKSSIPFYDERLIPIISDNEEGLLFNTNASKHYGQLYLFSVGEFYLEYPIACYDSLYSFIQTTIVAYKNGAYLQKEGSRRLDIDAEKLKEIAKRYNKKSKYWFRHDPLNQDEWYKI